jgi:hypothetical protein
MSVLAAYLEDQCLPLLLDCHCYRGLRTQAHCCCCTLLLLQALQGSRRKSTSSSTGDLVVASSGPSAISSIAGRRQSFTLTIPSRGSIPDFTSGRRGSAERRSAEMHFAGSPVVMPSQPRAPARAPASMDGQPGWSFNARRKSMQGGTPNHRRSLNIGNNVVSVDDMYKVRVL